MLSRGSRFVLRRAHLAVSRTLATSLCLGLLAVASFAEEPVDFRRDIQPILSNHCWNCHGLDDASRQAELRLDVRDYAIGKGGPAAIIPGNPQGSPLVERIHSTDPELMMPPPAFKKPLSDEQRVVLNRWIAQGAPYSDHWAFLPPKRLDPPSTPQSNWPRNEIDRFVLAQLNKEGLQPSSEATRSTWLRRVSLDLTGLPPSPEEVRTFEADQSDSAYETVVDRLLASTRHAERMTLHWLDIARYADTNGYNNDETRTMWPWRDWVINAFATNMPYRDFLRDQLAGDLVAAPTIAQQVATGFCRNHVLTTEGGIIEEEYHVEYVADRVHTAATVFMGLSMQCARCHDHKYDPLTQREYYRFAAFFDNVPDKVVGYNQTKMAEPLLKVPSPAQQADLNLLTQKSSNTAQRIAERSASPEGAISAWEQSLSQDERSRLTQPGLVAEVRFEEATGIPFTNSADSTQAATTIGAPVRTKGQVDQGIRLDGSSALAMGELGAFEADQPFSLGAWVWLETSEPATVLSKIDESNAFRGYDLMIEQGRVAFHMIHHWPDNAFKVVTDKPLDQNRWQHIVVTYEGSRSAKGVTIFIDGKKAITQAPTDNLVSGTIQTTQPFHIGKRNLGSFFKGQVDEINLFRGVLSLPNVQSLSRAEAVGSLAGVLDCPAGQRGDADRSRLRQHFLDRGDLELRSWKEEQTQLAAAMTQIERTIPATMVMREMDPPRSTYLLKRGQYDQRLEAVSPGVPAALAKSISSPRVADIHNRLDLATWLTSPEHPLTSRVAVNRWWELMFGMGLVETSEDFGIQGALPSHPELLDWLATELIAQNWNYRAILKKIALSAAYRQSSYVSAAAHERDPYNRLLARGPRHRLQAEMIRDQALAVSGLLVEKVGGESVKPYQPEGLWEDVSVERRDSYVVDPGDGRYRRSLYTFWKRTCPPPSMSTFDAPDRETCTVRRARTNTPLQALATLNDPTYVEAAKKLADRVLNSPGDDSHRLADAFRMVVGRTPNDEETKILQRQLSSAREHFLANPEAASQLLNVGRATLDLAHKPIEAAAWTTIISVLLNLHETVTKS